MTAAFALLAFALLVLVGLGAFLVVGGIDPAGRPRGTETTEANDAVDERGST